MQRVPCWFLWPCPVPFVVALYLYARFLSCGLLPCLVWGVESPPVSEGKTQEGTAFVAVPLRLFQSFWEEILVLPKLQIDGRP